MTIEALLKKTNLFLLDMDGTLYIDDIPIGAVRETLARLRGAGKRLVYCTNNSSKTPEEYRAKLERIGLWGEGDFVYTSGIAAAEYLKKHHAGKSVYLAGREALKEDFAARGEIAVDGVFMLKESVSPAVLAGGLETENGHVVVGRDMSTNLKGCFAAGDCTGRPYQYAKAAGEGNVAAHSVCAMKE